MYTKASLKELQRGEVLYHEVIWSKIFLLTEPVENKSSSNNNNNIIAINEETVVTVHKIKCCMCTLKSQKCVTTKSSCHSDSK